MGVRGLLTYVTENRLFVEHRLQDTVLIIDGLNLENELYSRFLAGHDDKAFGGDYTHLAVYIETFFKALLKCGVTPVVIMDGSFEADKIKKKLERFDQRLEVAKAIYEGRSTGGEEVNSLLNSFMFVQIIKRLKIAVYKSIFEADDIIPRIAADLNAPLLSGDSDFLIQNLPAGMIAVKDLLSRDFKVRHDKATGRTYLPCEIYRLESLQRCFPGLKAELVPLGGAILGNDYLDFKEANQVISKLPRPNYRHPKFRQFQIHTVFAWLASQSSPAAVVAYLRRLCGNPNHQLICCIEDRYLKPVKPNVMARGQTVEQYFKQNYDTLFKREPGIPKWAHDRFVEEQLQKRLVSIYRNQAEFFRPLIEDFSLNESSYETIFELGEFIYGLLRSEDGIPKKVNRYVRVGGRREDQKVTPAVKVAMRRLPKLSEIGSLSQSDRITLFYQILGLHQSVGTAIIKLTRNALPKLPDSTVDQLVTLLLSAIYMSQHFSADLWIEFLYSLLANFLLMGHFTEEESIPKLLALDHNGHAKLLKAFQVFDKIPVRTRSYKARIVHQYNCFQNCLNDIAFLAMILDLADVFNADLLVSGLQGTFIYNLTLSLASQTKPLSYLEDTLLGGPSFQYLPFFQQLLDLVLANSNRKFIATKSASLTDRDIVPKDVPLANAFENAQTRSLLVRALEPRSALDNLAELRFGL